MIEPTAQEIRDNEMPSDKIEVFRKYLLLFIIVFLSDDLLLTWDFSNGATLRLTQLAGGFVIALFLMQSWKKKNLYFPRMNYALYFLLGFCLIDGVALFYSYWLLKSLAYFLWLIFNIFFVLAVLDFVHGKADRFQWLLTVYMYSFVAIAVFAVFQFSSGVLTGWSPLLAQWWIDGVLPRANGLNYEPSYLVTYLLPGLCLWGMAWRDRWSFLKWRAIAFALVTLAICASGSRMGWLGLVLFAVYLGAAAFHHRKIHRTAIKAASAILLLVMMIGVVVIPQFPVLLEGTGIAGTASHSYTGRVKDMKSSLKVFKQHPVVGVSLGGIGAGMRDRKVIHQNNQKRLWAIEPDNITAELLAGTGVIGCLLFYLAMGWIILRLWQGWHKELNPGNKSVMMALILALIMELGVLQGNQNILRYYFWFQIAISLAALEVWVQKSLPTVKRDEASSL